MTTFLRSIAIVVAIVTSISITSTAQTFFTGRFSAAQQTAEVTSNGTGTAAVVLSEDGVRFFATVDSMTGPIAAAHFHAGAAGANGPVVRSIVGDFDGNSASGFWTTTDDEPLTGEWVKALLSGGLYLNIHTAANPGGELRAQLYPSSGVGMTARLTTDQQTAEVEGEGTGTAALQVTEAGVVYFATVSGLSGPIAAAHFHNARSGQNGGVVRSITESFVGNTAVGIWTENDSEPLTAEILNALFAGDVYLNVHTASNPGGEVRGQFRINSGWGFSTAMSAVPDASGGSSEASGTGSVTLVDGGIFYSVSVTGLSGPITAAHIHRAPAGTNGPPVLTITDSFDGVSASGFWSPGSDVEPLTIDLVRAMVAGELYVNVHTAAYPAGEVRGQITPDEVPLRAQLDAAQQTADVEGNGSGTAALNLVEQGLGFSVTVDSLSGPIVAAHFHRAPAGENGPVVRSITDAFVGNTAIGLWTPSDEEPLTDDLRADILAGNLYLNVHTAANPSGEIRGQVVPSGGTALASSLTTGQAGGEVSSEGSGTGWALLTRAGVVYSVTVDSLSGPIAAAHFHHANQGVNGPVVRTIDEFEGSTAHGVWTPADDEPLTPELAKALLQGELYFNIHTAANPAGEVRGQLRLAGGVGSAVQLDGSQQPSPVTGGGTGTAAITLTDAGLLFDLSVTGLSGPIAASHFHQAPAGENGPVVRGITDEFDGPTATGVWSPSDDQSLTADLVDAILRGDVYINIHTAANPGGEVRGQVRANRVVSTAIEEARAEVPSGLTLRQNYPNPFNPATSIEFGLSRSSFVSLGVFDVMGRKVRTLVERDMPAGMFRISFDGASLPSGSYFYRIETDAGQITRQMLLMK